MAPLRRPARFAAVEPKRHHNAPGPLLACALALANAPAVPIPAESAIEPKRSENMTVTWRRSALSMIWQEPRRRPARVQYGLLLPPMCPPLFGRIDVKSEFD